MANQQEPAAGLWVPWHHQAPEGFMLRGLRTQSRGLPVLHFIHGNSYSGLTYRPLWRELEQDFDIFLHDAQGHGDSDHGGRFVGWRRSAELAQQVWQEHRQHYPGVPCYGLGHSFGGVLTTLISARQPAEFERLLLLDPILIPPRLLRLVTPLQWLGLYRFNPIARKARKRRAIWSSREEARQALAGRGMFKGWEPDALAAYVDYAMTPDAAGHWQLKCAAEREAEIFSSYAPGLWGTLKRLETPATVLTGVGTYPFVQESLQLWQRHRPELQVEQLPGGHCFMQEQPGLTAERIRAWLS